LFSAGDLITLFCLFCAALPADLSTLAGLLITAAGFSALASAFRSARCCPPPPLVPWIRF
jgi:hypothetical protein